MKPADDKRNAVIGGVLDGVQFGISQGDEAHIMGILREQMYSDKVLAVLREYSSNAWDAHQMNGNGELPIEVTLPYSGYPVLKIRDFGPGLSQDDVFKVYSQYGASTKRDSNTAVGCLGIGSKSAFAYADTFTIISRNGGKKSSYVATLDASDKGVINLLLQEDISPEDTGVEIQVFVKPEDYGDFTSKAKELFKHFEPRPVLEFGNGATCHLPDMDTDRLVFPSGTLNYKDEYSGGQWHAIMGCVPYVVDLDKLDLCDAHHCLRRMSGYLKFNIGELQMAASREALRYTDRTKQALTDKFTALVDEYIEHAIKELNSSGKTFQSRLQALTLQKLGLALPEWVEELAKTWVRVLDETTSKLHFVRNESATNQLTLDNDLRILIADTNNQLKGYRFCQYDYVVRQNKGQKLTVDEITAELTKELDASGMTGVRVEKLSTLYYYEPYKKPKRQNPHQAKHKARMFRLQPDLGSYTRSENWEVEDREPTDDDIYVILDSFEVNFANFYGVAATLAKTCKHFGLVMPEIYGYKTTHKKPVDESKIKGKKFEDWIEPFFMSLKTPEREREVAAYIRRQFGTSVTKKQRNSLVRAFGEAHPITRYVSEMVAATELISDNYYASSGVYQKLAKVWGMNHEGVAAELNAIYDNYPLIRIASYDISCFYAHDGAYSDDSDLTPSARISAWREYVKMLDATQNRSYINPTKDNANDSVQPN